jgi:hypothetical protein
MAKGWGRPFEDPIEVDGSTLVTLRDAGEFIAELSEKEHAALERQAAMEALLLVAEGGGPTMFARIGIMRALNRGWTVEKGATRRKPAKKYTLIK